jgi:hypothetical protein
VIGRHEANRQRRLKLQQHSVVRQRVRGLFQIDRQLVRLASFHQLMNEFGRGEEGDGEAALTSGEAER